jgi:hypothetical protein
LTNVAWIANAYSVETTLVSIPRVVPALGQREKVKTNAESVD